MPTEQTTEVAVIVLDKLEQYFTAAQQVMDKYGGEAVDLGLNALRIDAASGLVVGVISLVFTCIVWRRFPPLVFFSSGDRMNFDAGICSSAVMVFSGVFAAITLGDLWAWVGLFYPELYAVHKFIIN